MRRGREGKEVGLSSRLRAAGRRGVEPRRPRDFGALCTPTPPPPQSQVPLISVCICIGEANYFYYLFLLLIV